MELIGMTVMQAIGAAGCIVWIAALVIAVALGRSADLGDRQASLALYDQYEDDRWQRDQLI